MSNLLNKTVLRSRPNIAVMPLRRTPLDCSHLHHSKEVNVNVPSNFSPGRIFGCMKFTPKLLAEVFFFGPENFLHLSKHAQTFCLLYIFFPNQYEHADDHVTTASQVQVFVFWALTLEENQKPLKSSTCFDPQWKDGQRHSVQKHSKSIWVHEQQQKVTE